MKDTLRGREPTLVIMDEVCQHNPANEEKIMKHPECPYCGSDQILCDAHAYWDYGNQSWELHATYDGNYFCSDCESDISIVNWEEDNEED